jgi:hypothetical protein
VVTYDIEIWIIFYILGFFIRRLDQFQGLLLKINCSENYFLIPSHQQIYGNDQIRVFVHQDGCQILRHQDLYVLVCQTYDMQKATRVQLNNVKVKYF